MKDIVEIGRSIEGDSVDGASRDPLAYKGLVLHNKIRCHRFVARFNVKSKIATVLSEGSSKIEPECSCDPLDELLCDKAYVHSLKERHSTNVGSNFTASHGSNLWHFSKQTNVKIDQAHQEMLNAIHKRMSQQKDWTTNR